MTTQTIQGGRIVNICRLAARPGIMENWHRIASSWTMNDDSTEALRLRYWRDELMFSSRKIILGNNDIMIITDLTIIT